MASQKDERILAAIIAGGVASGRAVMPSLFCRISQNGRFIGSNNGFGLHTKGDRGPCCAVGAGVLFAGIDMSNDPLKSFAKIHKVSLAYANGVSDGFEALSSRYYEFNPDYHRGRAVGEAAWAVFGSRGRIR